MHSLNKLDVEDPFWCLQHGISTSADKSALGLSRSRLPQAHAHWQTLLMQLSADLQKCVLNSTDEIKSPRWPSAHICRGKHEVAHLKPIRSGCEALDPAIRQHIMAQQFIPKKAIEPSFQPR